MLHSDIIVTTLMLTIIPHGQTLNILIEATAVIMTLPSNKLDTIKAIKKLQYQPHHKNYKQAHTYYAYHTNRF